MADGHDATLISKDRDANAVANPIYVQLTDGTDVALINGSGQLEVAGSFTSGAEYAEDSAHTTGDVGSFALTVRQDTLASSTSADGDYAAFKTNAAGALYVDVSNTTLAVTQSGTWDIGTLTTITNDVNIADGGNSITVDDGGTSLTVDGTVAISGDVNVTNSGTFAVQVDGAALTALQLIDDMIYAEDSGHTTADPGAFVMGVRNTALADLTSTDLDYSPFAVTSKGAQFVELLQGGAANSAGNPIYVEFTEGVSSSEVHDYNTAASVAKDATSNHDYTVANSTFLLKQITTSSSADVKVEVQTGPLASLTTVWVGFVGNKAGGTIQHKFCPPKEVPVASTGTVRLIRTNRGSKALDLYSTIEGNDI